MTESQNKFWSRVLFVIFAVSVIFLVAKCGDDFSGTDYVPDRSNYDGRIH